MAHPLWLLGTNQLPFFCSSAERVKGQRAAKPGCTPSLEQSINSFHQKQGVRFNLFSSLIRDFLRISHFATWLEMAVFSTALPAPRKAQGALPSICQAEQETWGGEGGTGLLTESLPQHTGAEPYSGRPPESYFQRETVASCHLPRLPIGSGACQALLPANQTPHPAGSDSWPVRGTPEEPLESKALGQLRSSRLALPSCSLGTQQSGSAVKRGCGQLTSHETLCLMYALLLQVLCIFLNIQNEIKGKHEM